jgi:hypothetical protein
VITSAAVLAPASSSFKFPMICSSVNFARFIVRPLKGTGLYSNLGSGHTLSHLLSEPPHQRFIGTMSFLFFVGQEDTTSEIRHNLTSGISFATMRRISPKRLAFSNFNCLVFVSFYRIAPRVVNVLVIASRRWHRAGFRSFRRWKSRCRGGPNSPTGPGV